MIQKSDNDASRMTRRTLIIGPCSQGTPTPFGGFTWLGLVQLCSRGSGPLLGGGFLPVGDI
jgi:hypothetical protein